MKKIIFVVILSLLVVCFTSVLAIGAEDSTQEDIEGTSDDWLFAKGNKIVDCNGNEVWLTGTSWFGFNTETNCIHGLWRPECNLEDALSEMADRGINVLRIPLSTELLYNFSQGVYTFPTYSLEDSNPNLVEKNSLEILDIIINHCKKIGMKIILSVQSPKSDSLGEMDPLWYKSDITTEKFMSSWVWVANRYKNDDTVIAYDLKNAPHGRPWSEDSFAKWDDSQDLNNWKYIAEETAKKILEVNPNPLIFVEGVESVPKEGKDYTSKNSEDYDTTWWGANLRGVAEYSINLGQYQNKLVYSTQDNPVVPNGEWYGWMPVKMSYQNYYDQIWRPNWAYIMEENKAPLFIAEWGSYLDNDRREEWMGYLSQFIKENKISHSFWCYNSNAGDTGGLVLDDFSTWDEEKYAILEQVLWKVDGKFAGLDHKIKLGANGAEPDIVFTGSNPLPTPTHTSYIVGDVDGNNSRNAIDFGLIKQYLLGLISDFPSPNGKKAADVDGDGNITAIDFGYYKQFLLGMIRKFPVENK